MSSGGSPKVLIREMGIFYRRDSAYSGESSQAIPH